MTEWRPVVGWDGVYEVSSAGDVRRLAGGRGSRRSVLKGRLSTGSSDTWRTRYLKVALHWNGKRHDTPVHHLVAEAFLGPRPLGLEINHKDGNPQNNRVDNLEYVTHSENVRHGWATTRRPRVA